jgi:hypothetical protein
MGNDVARLRWHWLHVVSSEVKASIDGGVICDHRGWIESRLRAAFSFSDL